LPVGDFLFCTGGGFLFGAIAGYDIKKVMKVAAVVAGLFVAGLAYLSYKGCIDVKWLEIENSTMDGTYNSQSINNFSLESYAIMNNVD